MTRLDQAILAEYYELKKIVHRETIYDASHKALVHHPDSVKIVEMGEFVLPALFVDLRDNGFNWVSLFALGKITGLDAAVDLLGKGAEYVPAEDCKEAWLSWARSWHYIEKEA